MRKILNLFIMFSFCTFTVKAQKQTTKILYGVVFASSGTTTFSDWETPFSLSYNLSPNICVVTNKTFHNLLYGFSNNTIRDVNGYFLNSKKNIDAYIALGKSLNLKSGYAGVGIERLIKAGDVNFFLFSELQDNFSPSTGTKDMQMNIGVHINIQAPLFVKK